MLALVSATVALEGAFRWYSIGTMVLLVVGGVLAGLDAPRLEAGLATPWMGVWERINIYAYMLWAAVLAVLILHSRWTTPETRTAVPPTF